jgi:pyruvate/2-oxoglutarate dehydrogenase complex dihydrolipoamide acyltransferase (E2) component
LGVGRIRPARGRTDSSQQLISLSLVVDRRFVDDAPAARFLAGVVEWIENPCLML